MITPDPSRVARRHLARDEFAPVGPKLVKNFQRRSGMKGVTSEHVNIGGKGRMRFFGPKDELVKGLRYAERRGMFQTTSGREARYEATLSGGGSEPAMPTKHNWHVPNPTDEVGYRLVVRLQLL